ncbi:MAG: enoyl-CoA hydratase [Hyphomicrobiales bacterium]|nr:enoyl-CoA hydratase [Hyphomicrobiales bacterium]
MAEAATPARDTGTVEVLQREDRGPVAVLTLNRPDARNSLSEELLDALARAFEDIGRSKTLRVVVLAASGSIYCAGHDLKELTSHRSDTDRGRAYYARIMGLCSSVMQTIVRCPKPVVAAVQGTATAAGCQLVASCDLAVASETATFRTPGVDIGLFCSTPMVALSRNIGRKRAMQMLLLGEPVDAADAAAMGLVNRVVPADRLMAEAMELAGRIAKKPTATVAIGKEAFYGQLEMPLAEAYDYAADVMVRNMLHRDSEEGIGAFLEKRPPDWDDA